MRERALRFGKTASMVGILTEPAPDTPPGDRPGILILNSGILHRAGASRLYVQLARDLAARGFTVLRFDFSGIGDSEGRKDTLPFEEAAVVETREAMDYLSETRGLKRFVLLGLCSGADMAYLVGVADDRVVGLGKLDAWAYRTLKWYLRHFGPRVLSLKQWAHSIRVRVIPKEGEEGGDDSVYVAPEYRRVFPPREQVAEGLSSLARRGVHLYYFFTGDSIEYLNHPDQYREAFPGVDFGDRLQVEYVPDATHTVTGLGHQVQVVRGIGEWADRVWGAGGPAPDERATAELAGAGG